MKKIMSLVLVIILVVSMNTLFVSASDYDSTSTKEILIDMDHYPGMSFQQALEKYTLENENPSISPFARCILCKNNAAKAGSPYYTTFLQDGYYYKFKIVDYSCSICGTRVFRDETFVSSWKA